MRTTVELSEEVYKELVRWSLEKYGNTKNLSRVLNEILRKSLLINRKKILEEIFGMWKEEKDLNLREISAKEWEKRVKEIELYD